MAALSGLNEHEMRNELLVFGYVRHIEKILDGDKIIPTGVTRLCFDYVHNVEYIYSCIQCIDSMSLSLYLVGSIF